MYIVIYHSMVYLIIILLVILIFLITRNIDNNIEKFSNTEAIQNISSLFNSDKMTVSNLAVTGSGTMTKLDVGESGNISNLNVSGTGTIGNLSATGNTNLKNSTIAGNLSVSGTSTLAGDVTMNGNTTTKNLNVNGFFTTKGIQANVIVGAWDQTAFVTAAKPYFNPSMPDGTFLPFLFVASNYAALRFAFCVKYGKQYFLINVMDHTGLNNPLINTSNNLTWRGNV